ncbi:MAG TPA: TIGR03435 family protein [Acidobacteriaceae bacterium]|nr:TIGR03435 family protein [Acidobacteriaceae bacterium]
MRERVLLPVLLGVAVGFAPQYCSAQASPHAAAAGATAAYVPTMTFDVASVHETPQANSYTVMATDEPHTSMMRLQNFAMYNLLSAAYGLQSYQIVNLPNWPPPAMFTIVAKSDAETDAKLAKLSKEDAELEKQHALQVLLADRFKLKVHWETREGDVFNLAVAKGGSKMLPAGSMQPTEAEKKWMGGDVGDMKLLPLHQQNHGRGYEFIGHSCPMEMLVQTLAGQFGRPVIDKTDLAGKYDFLLMYRGRWDSDRDGADTDPTLPLDSALKEQLGLQVEKAKGPIQVLVIDHVEKPTQN